MNNKSPGSLKCHFERPDGTKMRTVVSREAPEMAHDVIWLKADENGNAAWSDAFKVENGKWESISQ